MAVEANVRFFGPVRSIVGKKEQMVTLDDRATLRDVLLELGLSNGPKFQRYIVVEGATLNPALIVSINGRSVDDIQNLDVQLPTETTIDIMLATPIAGG